MKNILIYLVVVVLGIGESEAQTTYGITSNKSWASEAYPSYCSSCTFNISSGVTLNIDKSNLTCANCTFTGGNVSVSKDFTCQSCAFNSENISMSNVALNLQSSGSGSSTIGFSNISFAVSGTGSITANIGINLTSSTFTFSNTSFFNNNGGTLNATSSMMTFNDNAYFIANAGPVNLKTTSGLIAGSGSSSSNSYIKMNGPQLNIYDNSFIALGGKNNYYFNWSSYKSVTNNKTYNTSTNSLNCGHAGQNSCQAPNLYGAATLNSAGALSGNVLPVVLSDFTTKISSNNSVEISWTTQQEMNSSYFDVQRSNDGSNWKTIAKIYAKGNSSAASEYSYRDGFASAGTNYYRLVMVDMDGTEENSEISHVSINSETKAINIYPNPVIGSTFNIQVPTTENTIVNIFSAAGRILSTVMLSGQSQYQVKVPSGVAQNSFLAVQVMSNSKTQTFTILTK